MAVDAIPTNNYTTNYILQNILLKAKRLGSRLMTSGLSGSVSSRLGLGPDKHNRSDGLT